MIAIPSKKNTIRFVVVSFYDGYKHYTLPLRGKELPLALELRQNQVIDIIPVTLN